MPRLRVIGLTLLALAMPSLALGGEEPLGGTQTLSVSASLSGCGLAEAAIVCQIDTSWTTLEGADYYTVSVTRADGSVVDLGQSTGTARSVFVPYVGPGTYSVQVAAWGTPPGEEEPEVLAREKAFSTQDSKVEAEPSSKPGARGSAEDGSTNEDGVEVEPTEDLPGPDRPGEEPPGCEEPETPNEEEPAETDPEPPADAPQPAEDEIEPEPDPDEPPPCLE